MGVRAWKIGVAHEQLQGGQFAWPYPWLWDRKWGVSYRAVHVLERVRHGLAMVKRRIEEKEEGGRKREKIRRRGISDERRRGSERQEGSMMDGRGERGRRGRILFLSVQLAAMRCSFPADVKLYGVCRSIAHSQRQMQRQTQTKDGGKLGGRCNCSTTDGRGEGEDEDEEEKERGKKRW